MSFSNIMDSNSCQGQSSPDDAAPLVFSATDVDWFCAAFTDALSQ